MPRIVNPLTDSQVRNAKPKESEYGLYDGNGIKILVHPTGRKSIYKGFTNPISGARQTICIGQYPGISLKQARAEGHKISGYVDLGKDPRKVIADEKKEKMLQAAYTLRCAAEEWSPQQNNIKDKTRKEKWQKLEKHVFPVLGDIPMLELSAPVVIEKLRPLEEQGNLETLKRICQILNQIWAFAKNSGKIVIDNPLSDIKKVFKQPKPKNMPSIPYDRLSELLSEIAHSTCKVKTKLLLEFQLHTMTRPCEAAHALWEEIDFENRVWIIPASRMKRNLEHYIPLTDHVICILNKLKKMAGDSKYLFPSNNKPNKPLNEQTANAALGRMGYKGTLTAHGLRSISSTYLEDEGFDGKVIDAALSHLDPDQVRRAYIRTDHFKKRIEMMQAWSCHVLECGKSNSSMVA